MGSVSISYGWNVLSFMFVDEIENENWMNNIFIILQFNIIKYRNNLISNENKVKLMVNSNDKLEYIEITKDNVI